MKRFTTCLMVLLLVFPLVALGEVQLSDFAQSLAVPQETLVDGAETLDIIWLGYNEAGVLPVDGNAMEQILEQRFNVNITNVEVDTSNTDALNVMLATGERFDVNTQADFNRLAELGNIREVPRELIETYAPTLTRMLVEEAGEDWVKYASVGGKLYGIPRIAGTWTAPVAMGIRKDWFEAVGGDVDALPKTLAELETLLLKIVNDDPDGNGENDTYALGVGMSPNVHANNIAAYEMGAHGVALTYWYENAQGNPTYFAIDENYREALKVAQRWYKQGIYDPEVIIAGRAESVAKMKADKIAGLYGIDWMFNQLASGDYVQPEMVFIPPVSAVDGGPAMTTMFNVPITSLGTAFGRETSDEVLIRLLQMLDTIYADLDLWRYMEFGEPGETYVADEDGMILDILFTPEGNTAYGVQRYADFAFIPPEYVQYKYDVARASMYVQVMDYPTIKAFGASSIKTDAENEFSSATQKIQEEFYWKAVAGEIDIDKEWDGYVETWLNAGGREILEAKLALVN